MKPKPRIFKGPDGWTVERPRAGFGGAEVCTGFSSHEEAGQWLTNASRLAAAGPSIERARTPEPYMSGLDWPVVYR